MTAQKNGARKRILIVEDDEDLRQLILDTLSRAGYEAAGAADGAEALVRIAAAAPDALLMDQTLPDMTGRQILGVLAERGVRVPFIVMTGHGDERLAVEMMKLGATDYLVKDMDFLDLLPMALERLFKAIEIQQNLHETQSSLKESEEQFRQIAENIGEVFWLRSADKSKMLYINPAYEKVWGRSCQSLYENPDSFVDSVHDDDKPAVYAEFERYMNSDRFDLAYRIVRPDGGIRWVQARSFPVRNEVGEVIRHTGLAVDITERKRAEEQLKDYNEVIQRKLKTIIEPEGDLGTLELTDLIDKDLFKRIMEEFHRITNIASAIIDIHGEVLIGVGWQDICTRFHRCHNETLKNCIESDTLLTKNVPPGTVRTYRCKNNLVDMVTPLVINNRHMGNFFIGQYIIDDGSDDVTLFLNQARRYGFDEEEYIDAYNRVPRFKKETAEAISSFYFEFTRMITNLSFNNIKLARSLAERKRAEKENLRLQEQLSQSQKLESIGRLAGGVAHDFNNMLSVILGHAEMALARVRPDDPLHARLKEIQDAGQRSADLTRQLLTFARKQTIAPRVLDINAATESMLKLLRRLIGENLHLAWAPGKDLWPVKIDPVQLNQILTNLCVNARDAIEGVGLITIETLNAAFDEKYCARHAGYLSGEYVMLAVSDNGCGMDAETLSHLFEPFFTTKKMGKGVGLGLATVYGAVEQNKGFVEVYSEPGRGTTFKIYLPRHTTKASQETNECKPRAAVRDRKSVV